MLKKILLITIFLNLFSCGFHVIYSKDDRDFSHIDDLAAIRIKKDLDRTSQLLKNNLYDFLNPDNIQVEPKYFLSLHTEKIVYPTFITLTGASGRNKVVLKVAYELKNLESGALISQGTSLANDSYDVTINRYATSTSEETVARNLTKISAQDIRNSLVNDFIEVRKKCDNKGVDEDEELEKEKVDKLKVVEEFVCPLDSGKVADVKPADSAPKNKAVKKAKR